MLTNARPELPYSRATVVGAGLMGVRLAGVLASGGLNVCITDVRAEALVDAVGAASQLAGTLGAEPGSIRATTDLADAVDETEFVIEAIVENLEAKQKLFATISALNPTTVLASNSSVLPVTMIAAALDDGSRAVGTHWWNPPDLIPIVEVIRGERTADHVLHEVTDLLAGLGKIPVRVHKDTPGFVGNRIQHALWREAIALLEEGVADAATIDLVVRNTIGLRLAQMGPLENADYVGLDLTYAIHDAVFPALNNSVVPNRGLTERIADGDLGAKTGTGFLAWPQGRREQAAADLAAHVKKQLANRNSPTPNASV